MSQLYKVPSDKPFFTAMIGLSGFYILLIMALLLATAKYGISSKFWEVVFEEDIQYSIRLSLISCTITAILSVWIAIPIGYLMSRYPFRGKLLMDAVLDIPIVLPPLVIELLFEVFHYTPRRV